MFAYSVDLERYVNSRRQKVIERNKVRIENIKTLTSAFGKSELIKELTYRYIDSVERCNKEIFERPESTISVIANLRFLFETCITARLLVTEDSYKYKVKYSIYNHQLDKAKSLKSCASIDISRLNKLKSEEDALRINEKNISACFAKQDALYDSLDEEIALFLDNAEFNGPDLHKQFIESYMKEHQQREDEINFDWELTKKSLLSEENARSLFDFRNQPSKVDAALKDKRTWREKAKDANLAEMHSFIYDYTSALLHSTSYSILIPNRLDDAEITMILSLATRLSSDILKNLKIFSGIPNMTVIDVDAQ